MCFAYAKLCVAANGKIGKKDYPGLKSHSSASLCACVLAWPCLHRAGYMCNAFLGDFGKGGKWRTIQI